jgi:NAD(P)-dependent dehydrogenase (short-subunit alcohol dehydrogenase family)
VVTGAAGGIGRCITLALAREGMDVVLADINETGNARVAHEVEELGRRALCVTTDVRARPAFDRLLQETLARFGSCHMLVNNAGVFHAGGVLDSSDEQWERVINVNLWGVIHGSRVFGRHFAKQGEGHIVNVASAAGLVGAPGMTAYSASKFGVIGFSEMLRWELAQRGVGVTMVCPGVVQTDISKAEGVELEHVDLVDVLRRAPSPVPLALKIVRAVQRNRPRVLYARDAYMIALLGFLPYRLLDKVGHMVAKRALEVIRPQPWNASAAKAPPPRTLH